MGKIASTVEPELIRQLLEACGPVKEWKPATDPETGKMKGFGFCTYQEAEGVIVALRVLNELDVDGQKLALKCNKATEEYIDFIKDSASQRKEADSEQETEAQPESLFAASEAQAFEKVMTLVADRAKVATQGQDASAAARDFLAELQSQPVASGRRSDKRSRDTDEDKELERERQRQRKEERRKAEQQERAYRDALRAWESREREIQRELERAVDRERDLTRERLRQLRADNEVPDDDEEDEPWKRRFYSTSRRAADRRRRREEELQDDAEDREREQQAKMKAQAAKDQKVSVSLPSKQQGTASTKDTVHSLADSSQGPVLSKPDVKKKSAKAAVILEEEDEEEKPKRALIPIRYTDEELQILSVEDGSKAHSKPSQAAVEPGSDAADLKKKIMALVPKDRESVFGYNVAWARLDSAPQDVKERISGWVTKKIKELLGEEEPSFCEFIMSQIKEHTPAAEMISALHDILDEDTDSFVMKLYQVLIYETEKLAA